MAMTMALDGGNYYAQWGGDWALWAGTAIKFSDRTHVQRRIRYNEFGDYSFVADVNITVVPGFVVTPGIGWKHIDDDDDFDFNDERRPVGRLRPYPVHVLIERSSDQEKPGGQPPGFFYASERIANSE